MGLIASVLEFVRAKSGDAQVNDVKVDLPEGATSHHYQPAGVDSYPMPGDLCLLVPGPEKGSWVVAGFIDPNNAGTAEKGEVRLYARDGDGGVAATIRIRNNGDVHLGADVAEELISRADRTDARFDALEEKYNAHTHPQWACSGGDSSPTSGAAVTSAPDQEDQFSGEPTGCDRVYGT